MEDDQDFTMEDDQDFPISEDEESPRSDNFVLKLKLPAPQEKSHFCKECNKGFTSGKALGGHMSSAHVQANKDYTEKRRRHNKSFGTAAHLFPCKECGKGFQSEKSLYGHMRCHPERPHRGMNSPPPPAAAAPSPAISSEVDDGGSRSPPEKDPKPGLGLMSWPRETKRGRGPLGAIRAREEIASGYEVLRMVGSKKLESGGSSSKKNENFVDDFLDGDSSSKKKENEEGKFVDDILDERDKKAVELLMAARKKNKHMCDLCNLGFRTHQALGGHKSSHTKFKMSIVNSADVSEVKVKKKAKIGKRSKVSRACDDGDENARSSGFDLNAMPEEDDDENEKDSN